MRKLIGKIMEQLEQRKDLENLHCRHCTKMHMNEHAKRYNHGEYCYMDAINIIQETVRDYLEAQIKDTEFIVRNLEDMNRWLNGGREGWEMTDLKKIKDYIQREINPYGKPFEGSVYEFGLKIMKYIDSVMNNQQSKAESVKGDLISRSALIESLKEHFDAYYREDGKMMYSDHICTSEDCDDLIKFVQNQPNAYDVEVIIKELKALKGGSHIDRLEVYQAVRKGGVHE